MKVGVGLLPFKSHLSTKIFKISPQCRVVDFILDWSIKEKVKNKREIIYLFLAESHFSNSDAGKEVVILIFHILERGIC